MPCDLIRLSVPDQSIVRRGRAAAQAISVLCTDTEERAAQLRKLSDYTIRQFEQGCIEPMRPAEQLSDHVFTADEALRIRRNAGRIISGTPESVREQLTALAEDFGAEEVIVTTMTDSREDRLRSFTLPAEAFDLKKQSCR
jgi:alkanesulfonate monooxygenase SsuD/methylene tetrahydromethanopterin reductase-like flavin-dependent oxidoreductase (luciferase family)